MRAYRWGCLVGLAVAAAVACGGQAEDDRRTSSRTTPAGSGGSANDDSDAGAAAGEGSGVPGSNDPGPPQAGQPSTNPGPSGGGVEEEAGVPGLTSVASCHDVADAGQTLWLQYGDEIYELELVEAKLVYCSTLNLHLEACAEDICVSVNGSDGVVTRTTSGGGENGSDGAVDGAGPDRVTASTTVEFAQPDWPSECYLQGDTPIMSSEWLELTLNGQADGASEVFPYVTLRVSIPVEYEDPGCLI